MSLSPTTSFFAKTAILPAIGIELEGLVDAATTAATEATTAAETAAEAAQTAAGVLDAILATSASITPFPEEGILRSDGEGFHAVELGSGLSLVGNVLDTTGSGGGGAVSSVVGETGDVSAAQIAAALDLATVATTGAYADLSGKPTIPSVPSAGLVRSTGSALAAVTLGAGLSLSGATLSATATGAVDSVVGQTGTVTAGQISTALGLATVATSGLYSDLGGRPSLATVATSGAYADLSGKPTIPTVPSTGIVRSDGTSFATVTIGSGLSFSGGTLSATGGGGGSSPPYDISDITGLQTALDGKAATSHTHSIANVTSLQTTLDGKASTGAVTSSGLTAAGQRLVGRGSGTSGALEEILIGNGLSLSSTTLSAGGLTSVDKGTGAAASTQTFDVSAAGHQKLTVGGALTVAFSNWPAGFGELLIELVNGGSHIVTWPTVKWLRPDGSYTTVFGSTNIVLNSGDTDWILIWTGNGGTTLFGKVMR